MMPRFGHISRRAGATLLVTVFAVGGLMAPALHRAHHGVMWARLKAESCDHSQHGARIEAPFPLSLDDDCLLCTRQLVLVEGSPLELTAYQKAADYRPPRQFTPRTSHLKLLPIRAPPLPA